MIYEARLLFDAAQRMAQIQDSIQQVQAAFDRTTDSVALMLDQLKQTPLPAHLQQWETDGGALG